MEVQRGAIENLIRSMIGSAEFQTLRQQQSPAQILDAFYRGLPARPPDGAGLREYLGGLQSGRDVQAIMHLAQSEEFERLLWGR